MAKPDWDALQRPNEKSKDNDKRDHGHGPGEHGLGGKIRPEEKAKAKELRERKEAEESIQAVDIDGEPIAGYAAYFYVSRVPPVTDQDGTPMCVAYSNAYDQNQQDRPEQGYFKNFDEATFFQRIGGGPNGAYMSDGLQERQDRGYPPAGELPNAKYHRIAGYTQVPTTVAGIKAALVRGHGVLFIGDWFHSWFHPFASGKLPARDYVVGGHAYWVRGWNDTYGFRVRNSWGKDWGLSGDCFIPYAFLETLYAAYRTTDR